MGRLTDFLAFWGGCFLRGAALGNGAFAFAEGVFAFVWLFYSNPVRQERARAPDKSVKAFFRVAFFVLFAVTTFIVAPYQKYQQAMKLAQPASDPLAQKRVLAKEAAKILASDIDAELDSATTNGQMDAPLYLQSFGQRFGARIKGAVHELDELAPGSQELDWWTADYAFSVTPQNFNPQRLYRIAKLVREQANKL